LSPLVRVLCAVVDRRCQPLVAAVAVTVAVSGPVGADLQRGGSACAPWPLTCALDSSVGAGPRAVSPGLRTPFGPPHERSPVTYRCLCRARSPTAGRSLSSGCELLASSPTEPRHRASPTSGSGIRTVDVLLLYGEH
jgi:hypothetical protein